MGRTSRFLLVLLVLLPVLLLGSARGQDWAAATDGTFTVLTASSDDARHLPQVFEVLQRARRELRDHWQLPLLEGVTVAVHPTLTSFTGATGAPWFIAGVGDRAAPRVDVQRLRVLLERQTLEATLRHELLHLAQPADWPRWRAEGTAMLFAGETPRADPFPAIAEAQLEMLLAAPASRQELARAAATAYRWVVQGGAP